MKKKSLRKPRKHEGVVTIREEVYDRTIMLLYRSSALTRISRKAFVMADPIAVDRRLQPQSPIRPPRAKFNRPI